MLDCFDELVLMWLECKCGVESSAQMFNIYLWLYVSYKYFKRLVARLCDLIDIDGGC
ncbi:hypothetical protein D3C78_1853260 [compost metagenome]